MTIAKIRTIIVDDEKYGREELHYLLQVFPNIVIVGEAQSGTEAIAKVMELQPDLLFLDIEMPEMNGKEVASIIKQMKQPPYIVFATAYPQFAVDAFQLQAKGYLVKPIDEVQLAETISQVENAFAIKSTQEKTNPAAKLAVDKEDTIHFLDPESILYAYRDEKNTKVQTNVAAYESKFTLKELEHRLAPYAFFRVHKSYLVNTAYISEMNAWFNGAYQLTLTGVSEQIPVSRNYVKPLRKMIEL
ncbi:LytR/AlgR family response regulator transcription factor [Shouchella lehensis]|uniref:Sensory transduction protein lytT n=1 Tax=Shouchella lehensis G1 TaxID=1246626 RepID=A0A060M538_9BACI|nr:LytTR family DNA-binding domain-containing protein [Shouchella lehensis]AIC95668.1 Sensory transduction protein lytT [Shouchella lehensis G1]